MMQHNRSNTFDILHWPLFHSMNVSSSLTLNTIWQIVIIDWHTDRSQCHTARNHIYKMRKNTQSTQCVNGTVCRTRSMRPLTKEIMCGRQLRICFTVVKWIVCGDYATSISLWAEFGEITVNARCGYGDRCVFFSFYFILFLSIYFFFFFVLICAMKFCVCPLEIVVHVWAATRQSNSKTRYSTKMWNNRKRDGE